MSVALSGVRFLAILAPVEGVIWLLVGELGLSLRAEASQQAKERLLTAARLGACAVNERFCELVKSAEACALRRPLVESCYRKEAGEAQSVLRDLIEAAGSADRAFLVDANGVAWAGWPQDPSALGKKVAHRDWFQAVARDRRTYVSEVYERADSPAVRVIEVAVPVFGPQGKLSGVLVVEAGMDRMRTLLAEMCRPASNHVFLLDRARQVSLVLAEDPAAKLSETIRVRAAPAAEFVSEGEAEERWVHVEAPIPRMGGSLVVRNSLSNLAPSPISLADQLRTSGLFAGGLLSALLFVLLELSRRRMEDLKRREEDERRLSQRKSDYAAFLAHELRSPLTAIMGFADLLLDNDDPKASREQIRILKDRAAYMNRLIDDLLDASKIEAGRMDVNPQPFDLIELIREVAASFEAVCKGKGIRIVVPEQRMVGVKADRLRINQVLTNILANSVRYTERGEVRVEVVERQGSVNVLVVDTGPGMKQHETQRLFERYVTIRPDSKEVRRTGLGMYLSKELVRLHGGDMWVESEEGKGTRVYFTLPRA